MYTTKQSFKLKTITTQSRDHVSNQKHLHRLCIYWKPGTDRDVLSEHKQIWKTEQILKHLTATFSHINNNHQQKVKTECQNKGRNSRQGPE